MPDPANPANHTGSEASGSNNPTEGDSSRQRLKEKDKESKEEERPIFNPGTEDFKNFQGDMLRMIFEKFIAQGTPSSSPLQDRLHWGQLAKDISPSLSLNGTNFPLWSASLQQTIHHVTGAKDYFNNDLTDVDPAAANGIFVLIEQSIDPLLRSSILGLTAYGAYKSLASRFERPSWSLLVSRWNAVAKPPDGSDSVAASYKAAKRNWADLEKRLGGLTVNKLASLLFYSSVPRYQTQLANALDHRMAVLPNIHLPSEELLNLASRFAQSADSAEVSAISRGGSRGSGFRRGGNRSGGGNSSN
jgi:hypothetical protein